MVTPLEFVQVPGIDRPVLKRPATSHIPIITAQQIGATPQAVRSSAGTDVAADASGEEPVGSAPIAANSAYGLDPLDADTAGLGRARRLRLVQLAVLVLGVIALIVGITLVISGIAG